MERLARGDALPFLSGFEHVIPNAIGQTTAASLDQASLMLRRHGVVVQPQRVAEADGAADEFLLAQAGAEGADLRVMSAYGPRRQREFVFGGVTRRLLRAATLPILFGG